MDEIIICLNNIFDKGNAQVEIIPEVDIYKLKLILNIYGINKNSTIKLIKQNTKNESYDELRKKINKLWNKYEELLNKYEALKKEKENENEKKKKDNEINFNEDKQFKLSNDLDKLKLSKNNQNIIHEDEKQNNNNIKINLINENNSLNQNNSGLNKSSMINRPNKYMTEEEIINETDKIKKNIDELFQLEYNDFKAINYDLTKFKINCGKEEIKALVSDGNNRGIKKEDLNDYVLEKIALTLPQDILINLKISVQKQAKNFRKVLDFYKKGEHSNFSKFLETLKFKKNIVYTLTEYSENFIDDIYKINNDLVGEIDMENIKFIEFNFNNIIRGFEDSIDDYLNEDNFKVCIIKFLPCEGLYMKYINYYIENNINKYNNNDKKIFIFIVYMSRIFFQELSNKENNSLQEKGELNKKILTETISNLSGYYQIFIDDLKNENKLKFEDVLMMQNKELFDNLINFEKILMTNIFSILSYIKYNKIIPYKGITNDNYADKIVELINNNKRLRYIINEAIFNQSFQKDNSNIISIICKDKNSKIGKTKEILKQINYYLIKKYSSEFALLYFRAEKDQFFSSLLTNRVEKKIMFIKEKNNDIKHNNEMKTKIDK